MSRRDDARLHSAKRKYVRRLVLEQETTCHICGLEVDKRLPRYHPGSPVVDEVIPRSKGGDPEDRSNCRLAHWRCNASRGNKTPEPRRRPSRVW